MTDDVNKIDNAQRRGWLAVLARASLTELEAFLPTLGELPSRTYIRSPEVGMVMLRGRVGGTGDAFNLGEASVTRCALRMAEGPLGVGYTLGRNRRKAELIAVYDALLQVPDRRAVIQGNVIGPLSVNQADVRNATGRAAASSKVEFYTMVRGEA